MNVRAAHLHVFFAGLLVAFLPFQGPSRAQSPNSVPHSGPTIGVVRGDGVLLPLASRENDGWTNLRFFDDRLIRLVDADRIPRQGWTYVPAGSGEPRPLAVRDLTTTDAHCGRQEGFATDAPPPRQKLEAPHLMSGVATHGTISAVRVEHVAHQPDEASRRVAQFIVQLTQSLEAERASAVPRSPRAPTIPPQERARVPVRITTLARDRIAEVDYYYFEAHKRYGRIETYANGWLASSPFSVSVVRIDGGIYAGGETARRWGRVLGVLRILQHSVWVMEMQAYEGVLYDIVEMGTGQLVSIHGGGC